LENLLFSNENLLRILRKQDGTNSIKDGDLTQGVYVFFIEYKTTKDVDVYAGDVTAIR
jgi:hypothetical protein